MSLLGLDVSHWQTPPLPWAEWVAGGLSVAVIQVTHGPAPEPHAAEHLAGSVAAHVPHIGAYHYLMPGNTTQQVTEFLKALDARYEFCALDVEQAGVSAESVVSWCALFAAGCPLPLALYGNYSLLVPVLNAHPELKRYPVWWAQYAAHETPPVGLHVVGWQKLGSTPGYVGHLPPYEGAIDLTDWFEIPGTDIGAPYTASQPVLGPHHAAGGMETGRWLQLVPKVAKAIDSDLGALKDARPGTITIGRCNDLGKLSGQGFDANRYQAQGMTPEAAALMYFNFLAPFVASNPWVQAWEGPNEQVITDPAPMSWYAEFAYQFSARLHGVGKRAVVGNWASGTPREELNLWGSWARGLQASRDFGALQAYHDYAIDTSLPRAHYNAQAWAALGYPNLTHIITELGLNEFGGGWRKLYPDWNSCFAAVVRPWLDAVSKLDFPLYACWFTDGGTAQWAGHDVSGTNIVATLATYTPPQKDTSMPYIQDTDWAAITAIVEKYKTPVKHNFPGYRNQDVINLFHTVFGDFMSGLNIAIPNWATTMAASPAQREAPYAGLAIEDMPLTDAQKAKLLAALPAG